MPARMKKSRPNHSATTNLDGVELLGPPAILPHEDELVFYRLLFRVEADVNPQDIFEQIWVRDIADLTWEIMRLRRCKAALLTMSVIQQLDTQLLNHLPKELRAKLLKCCAQRDSVATPALDRLLADMDISMDLSVVSAVELCHHLDNIERIDRLIGLMVTRRNATLREINRHRVAHGELRRTIASTNDE